MNKTQLVSFFVCRRQSRDSFRIIVNIVLCNPACSFCLLFHKCLTVVLLTCMYIICCTWILLKCRSKHLSHI